ncbi:MAG: hypothetical protein IKX61_00285 [Prevotella sp.]|nr:hypothetical protein [Prevotella sp.]
MADYYDDNINFLFVKKGKDAQLQDYIFVHLNDADDFNFLAHYESYKSDMPLEIYKLHKVMCLKEEDKNFLYPITDVTEEQTWKRVRVSGMLPSKWRMYFETIEEEQKNKR